jgi:hypothetical protein
MTLRLFPLLLALIVLSLFTGCGLFSKKNAKPKESSAIAADVEETFRRRWVEKRTAELTAQGVDAATANTQAANEFQARFGLTPQKKR